MNIGAILSQEAVLPSLEAKNSRAVLEELTRPLLAQHPEIAGFDVVGALRARESMGSTAIGDGVAIPHCKVPGLSGLTLAVGRSLGGIDFNALDNSPCHIFYLILAPETGAGQHLRLLAQIARRAKDPVFGNELMFAETRTQLWQALTAP